MASFSADSCLKAKLAMGGYYETQTWTSDTEFNIQFGTDASKDKWLLIVQTNCPKNSKNCKGKFTLAFDKDKSREGNIACSAK